MNITLERTESSKIKYELENAITFNKKLFEDISYPSFLYNMIGSCNAIQLITLDYLITKYEKECNNYRRGCGRSLCRYLRADQWLQHGNPGVGSTRSSQFVPLK